MDFHIVERLGGPSRCITLFTFAIHFLHALFSVVNYLAWVRQEHTKLAMSIQHAYLAMAIVCCFFYFFGASVLYMWAWRFPEPEEIAKRRRVYGVVVNAIFCDVPMFIVETIILWEMRFAAAIQGFTYCLTCISLCYSLLRVWFFFMVRVIKFRLPNATRLGTNYPALSGVARHDLDQLEYNNSVAGLRSGGGGGGNMTEMGSPGVGNTIVLNRNAAGAFSEDGASAGMHTPAANRVEAYYGPPSASRYAHQSARYDEFEEQPRRGYYGRGGGGGESADELGVPFRI